MSSLEIEDGESEHDDDQQIADKIKHNVMTIVKMSNATPIQKEGLKKYFCAYCSFRHPNPIELKKHTLEFHDKNLDFLSKMTKKSLLIKLDITGLNCGFCHQSVDTHENLIAHLTTEHEVNFYKDVKNPIIPFRFDEADSSRLSCVFCNEEYNNFAALTTHTTSHYGADFVCEKCGQGCMSRKLYIEHQKTHDRQCHICRKIFYSKASLEIHYLTHTGQKNHQCDYCKKMYKTKTILIEHLKIHLNIRDYKCHVCGMTFVQKASWKGHVRSRHKIDVQ